jgi:hypothetical protein
MRGISWLAERTLSFLRRTLLHGISSFHLLVGRLIPAAFALYCSLGLSFEAFFPKPSHFRHFTCWLKVKTRSSWDQPITQLINATMGGRKDRWDCHKHTHRTYLRKGELINAWKFYINLAGKLQENQQFGRRTHSWQDIIKIDLRQMGREEIACTELDEDHSAYILRTSLLWPSIRVGWINRRLFSYTVSTAAVIYLIIIWDHHILWTWKDWQRNNRRHYLGIHLKELSNTKNHFNRDNQCPGRDLNRCPIEYK